MELEKLNGMSVLETISKHRSIRKYEPRPLPGEHVEALMRAALRAPTDAAMHLWTAIRTTPDQKRVISEWIGQPHVAEAGEFFVFLADLHRVEKLLEYRGERRGRNDFSLLVFAAIDAALAAENMALAAESLGYGICFIGAVQNAADRIIDLLKLPPHTYPLFGLTIGVPAENPPTRPRLPLDLMIHEGQYRSYSEEDMERAYREMAPYSRRRDWLRMLKRYAAEGGYFEAREGYMRELFRKMGFNI